MPYLLSWLSGAEAPILLLVGCLAALSLFGRLSAMTGSDEGKSRKSNQSLFYTVAGKLPYIGGRLNYYQDREAFILGARYGHVTLSFLVHED